MSAGDCIEAGADEVAVRTATQGDALEIHAILAEAPEAVLWSVQSIVDVIRQPNCPAFVCQRGGSTTGFVLARRIADEAEILNIAVRKTQRRRGDGNRLMAELFQRLRHEGAAKVFLEVRESNANAIRFYESFDFTLTGKRTGYYREPTETALVLARLL